MKELNPKDTPRAQAFELWMTSPMPMVTLTKTFDVTALRRYAYNRNSRFNMLLCWCIGKAASQIEQFFILPIKDKMVLYDRIAVNVIVTNIHGGINSCDIPFSDDIEQFKADYMRLTQHAARHCTSSFIDDAMIIGTSALVSTELDCIVNQYTDKFSNPMVMWGRYRKHWFKTTLPISFQFHHVQMDGGHAAQFLNTLQIVIKQIKNHYDKNLAKKR